MKLIDYLKEEGTTVDKCSVITIDLFNKPRYRMFDYPTNEAVHSFAITKVSGEEGNIYYEYDNDGCNDFSKDINLADVYLYGSVKWDGCSNWMYPEQTKNCMLHFCSVEEAQLVAEVMKKAYEIASQQISSFEG